jgi:phosphatidylserine decarboxylase
MPISGTLREMVHIPGRLFSVAPHCVRGIPRLFARNERVVTLWETEVGPMALVLVGAIFVGSIETVWAGEVTPPRARRISQTSYADGLTLSAGAEMGRFNMGSTVIVVLPRDVVTWDPALTAETRVRMGQTIGRVCVTAG